jgi:hypothetical protein
MPTWIDNKYINLVSPKLPLFKWKKSNLANFRCVFCGDSKKDTHKARGYLFTKAGKTFYRCHNCNVGMTLPQFLRQIDFGLYEEYQLENFENRIGIKAKKSSKTDIAKLLTPPPLFKMQFEFKRAIKLSTVDEKHPAKAYLLGRKIPTAFVEDAYYTDNLHEFIKENVREDKQLPESDYILILIKNQFGLPIGFNCRAMAQSAKKRYIKIRYDDSNHLLFGIDRLDKTKDIYVVEGEFDAMFIDNAIAVGGVTQFMNVEKLLEVEKEKLVIIPDNERHSKEVCHVIAGLIDKDYRVVLFPETMSGKDINDMVMNHKLSCDELKRLIDGFTYTGIRASLEFSNWRKV